MTLTTLQTINFILQWAMPLLLLLGLVLLVLLVVRFRKPSRRRYAAWLGFTVALLTACGFTLSKTVKQEYIVRRETERAADYARSSLVKTGDAVPSFAVTDTKGQTFSTDDSRGRVLLINFFATWCGPCLLELPHLQEIDAQFRDNPDFEAISIGRGETREVVRAFQEKRKITMRMAPDANKAVFSKFASNTIPRTVIVSKDGTIVFSRAGFYERDLAEIRKLIQQNL